MARIRGVDMQIDASIPLGVRPPQFDSPLETYGKVEQLKGLRAQGQLRDLQMQEFQDKRARQQNLRGILGQGLQGQDLVKALQTGGYLDESTAYAKQMREEQDANLKREGEIVKLQGDLAKFVMSNPTEQAAIGAIARMEAATGRSFDSERATVYSMRNDPAALRKWAGGYALSAEQQLPKFERFDTGGQVQMGTISPFGEYAQAGVIDKTVTPDAVMADKRAREEGAANRAVTVRGQNMTDSRARELAAATREQGGKPPAGYRWANNGTALEVIPGGPADKAANVTEGERKAATLLKRMDSSLSQLESVTTVNPDAASPGLLAETLRNIPFVGGDTPANMVTPEARQRVEAAQLDILDAALTLGTGAAYTREQLQGYRRSYFPQVGDSPETIKDKSARLQNVLQAARIAAGRAAPEEKPKTVQTDSLPDPAQYPGAVMRDDQTGARYQSDGKSWRRL